VRDAIGLAREVCSDAAAQRIYARAVVQSGERFGGAVGLTTSRRGSRGPGRYTPCRSQRTVGRQRGLREAGAPPRRTRPSGRSEPNPVVGGPRRCCRGLDRATGERREGRAQERFGFIETSCSKSAFPRSIDSRRCRVAVRRPAATASPAPPGSTSPPRHIALVEASVAEAGDREGDVGMSVPGVAVEIECLPVQVHGRFIFFTD